MTNITIPPEAVEKAAKTLCRERHPCWSIVAEIFKTDRDGQATEFRILALAAIRAAINAWPGMQHRIHIEHAIILPLPQENTDAEA